MKILVKPLVTEKANALQEKGVYTFKVDWRANKIQIKEAVEKFYSVNVEKVRTINVQGKSKTRYTKRNFVEGRTASYKKALIQLSEGEFIDFYEDV